MRCALVIITLACAAALHAQQDGFRSKLGLQAGVVRSLGDIGSGLENFDPQRTAMIGVSYERFLSYGVSLYGGYERLWLSGNDRETGRMDRSLNFLADMHTVQLGMRFHADNGQLLNYDARFAPFVQLGIGVGTYEVYGDLYDDTGARYNYWSDGSIRTLPQDHPDAAFAQHMEQNGVFGTRLTQLATENGKPRDTWFIFVPARLGLKWRISDRFSAELAYAFNWTFTDHIDDVSGDYPATFATEELAYISNPAGHAGPRGNNGRNDHFHHLGLGLSVGLGRRSHQFRMPPVRVPEPVVQVPPIPQVDGPPMIPAPAPVDTAVRRMVVEVETIRVARLEVDTLIVRGVAMPEDRPRQRSEAPRDTTVLVPDTLRTEPGTRDTTATDERREQQQRALSADTLKQAPVPVVRDTGTSPADTLQQPEPRTAPADPQSRQEPEPSTDEGDPKTTQPAAAGTVEHRTTERIIERAVPPVVVVQKELVRDTVVKEVFVLVPDTARAADTTAVTPEDPARAAATTPLPPGPAPPGRSALEMQRDHAMQMNSMLNDRIRTLERYLAIQEAHGGAAEIDSLRLRIAALDAELEALRGTAREPLPDTAPAARMAIMDTMHFASNSFHVRQAYRESLERTASRIVAENAGQVLVTGHTDRSGDAAYNMQLSQRRAEAVADVLRAAGVPAGRIKVKGMGQELASERHDRNERIVVVQVAAD